MPQPIKSRHGVYKFRKVVPKKLRAALGKSEILISLETKDPKVAKERYQAAADEAELDLKRARSAPIPLTTRQIAALTGIWFRRLHDELGEDASNIAAWERLVSLEKAVEAPRGSPLEIRRPTYAPNPETLRHEVLAVLTRADLKVDASTEVALIASFGRRVVALQDSLWRNLNGHYAPAPKIE